VIDYHVHLWPHGERERGPTIEDLAVRCEHARRHGVRELAVTEHLFRFAQADALLGGWWDDEPDPGLRSSMAAYWAEHAHADLDRYVEVALEARAAGLPVVLGLEVDLYPGRMDQVATLLAGYPFDVLLGSVHWLGTWRFDDLHDPVSMAHWDRVTAADAWARYTDALEELAGTGACDVLAHIDLVKVTGHRPAAPEAWWQRMVGAALHAGMAVEVSSSGWRKPVAEAYPDPPLLERLIAAGVPLTMASDGHRVGDVAYRCADLRTRLLDAGVTRLRTYRDRRPGSLLLEAPVDTAPHDGAPGDTAPHDGAPGDTAPHDGAPGDTAPHDTVPGDTAPHDGAPGDTAPHDTVPGDTMRARAEGGG
jgi:histidinol-phosphatase (PHP family)